MTTQLPEWMRPGTAVELPVMQPASRRHIARRTLARLARLVAEVLTDEAVATRPGLLQRIDPRAKVIGLIGLLVASTFVHHLPALAGLLGFCLLLAAASRIPLRRLAGACLVPMLFSAVIILPSIFSHTAPGRLAVTEAGLASAGRFLLGVMDCILLAMLLAITTRPHRLFRGLRALGVPQLFVMLLGMMQRYLILLVQVAEEMHLGKLSRSIFPGRLGEEQRWVTASMGALFRRTQMLSNTVYLAMLSRGYTGEVHLLDESRWRGRDWAFLAVMAAISAGILFWK